MREDRTAAKTLLAVKAQQNVNRDPKENNLRLKRG